jgi:hypothetical protein
MLPKARDRIKLRRPESEDGAAERDHDAKFGLAARAGKPQARRLSLKS